MKACICKRPPSGIDHHGWRSVTIRVHVSNCVGDSGGLTVYMTQCGGCGAISLISTFSFCDSDSESYCVTAILAAASLRLKPRMFAWARIL